MPESRIHILTSSFLFLLITLSYLVMALEFPIAYIVGTYEDFVGEWAQVFLFFSVFLLSLRLIFTKSRFRVFFVILALASFYTFMEEISWGQRIFNITSPEIFQRHNLQRETNLHNFITGPYNTVIKSLIEYLLFIGLITYGLIYPYLLKGGSRIAKWIESKGLLSPPLYLWPYFVLSAVLELGIFGFNEAEIAEILIPSGLAIMLLHYLFINRSRPSDDFDEKETGRSNNIKLALSVCGIFIFAIIASAGATYANYFSLRLKDKMESKMLNGIEKFAGRYKRYEKWDLAIYLYEMVDEQEPDRPSIQRKLAYCYGKMGDHEEENDYIERAFEIDREKLEFRPDSISANLSIASTFKQIGDDDKEKHHLNEALHIALKRAKDKPGSASASYWLGRAYSQSGNDQEAFKYYEKAFTLRPNQKKYRKVYMNSRRDSRNTSDKEE